MKLEPGINVILQYVQNNGEEPNVESPSINNTVTEKIDNKETEGK